MEGPHDIPIPEDAMTPDALHMIFQEMDGVDAGHEEWALGARRANAIRWFFDGEPVAYPEPHFNPMW